MQFLILISVVILNIQLYKLSQLFIVKDEQDRDFAAVPTKDQLNGKLGSNK